MTILSAEDRGALLEAYAAGVKVSILATKYGLRPRYVSNLASRECVGRRTAGVGRKGGDWKDLRWKWAIERGRVEI